MSLRPLSLALLLAAATAPLGAQILQMPTSRHAGFWAAADIGYFMPPLISDGSTQSRWDFGSAVQYRMSIERPVGNGATLGAVVARADAPLLYRSFDGVSPCQFGCDAKATVWNLVGAAHIGGGLGFHQVLDIAAGITRYASFHETATGQALAPRSDSDLSISVGYGFGVGFSERVEITFVQDAGLSFHQRGGLAANASSATQQLTTRIGLRYGFGTRPLS